MSDSSSRQLVAPTTDGVRSKVRETLAAAGLLGPSRRAVHAARTTGHALWSLNPRVARVNRFQKWLLEADRRDNERMALVMASVLSPNSNCVDIGAAGGGMLEIMTRLSPHGRHIAYEPLPEEFARLQARFPAVSCRNVALSDTNGVSEFAHVVNGPGFSSLRVHQNMATRNAPVIQRLTVPTVRLDDDLPRGYVPTLIKIDVNGAEGMTLAGAVQTLRTHKPLVLFEHGMAAKSYGTTPSEIHEVITRAGELRIFDLEGNGPLDPDDFARATEKKWNFVARA